jgi:polyisoprenoid-binding protein YceI
MRKNLLTLAFGLLALITVQAQRINTTSSKVEFEIGNMAFRVVDGSFGEMSGQIQFNPANLSASTLNVCINPATVNTDNEKRDEHLKNEDFFDVTKYPTICFESTRIEKNESGYVAYGKLTLHRITKEIEIPFTYSKNEFKGTLNINRLDYNLGENTSTFMVADEVEITITCLIN